MNQYPPDAGQPLIAHLVELRGRLLRMLAAILLIFLLLFPFANELYALLARPLLLQLPQGASMIATEVAAPFLAPFKFTMVLAFFISIPLVLYQVWGFVAPGLYKNERRLVLPLLLSSTLLFYGGMLFAYFVVFPLIFDFLVSVAPAGVTVMTDISKYLEFVLKLFFAFGLAFEVPIATIVLVWGGVTTPEHLIAKRPYVIVGAFVIGMLLTPPDMISQTLLAVPMWLLFEAGIVFSRFFVRDGEIDVDSNDAHGDKRHAKAAVDGGSDEGPQKG
jgi:sec-independent protein translocase protein TatC